jgi:hypothetical protein
MNYILDKGAQSVYPYTVSMLRQDNPNIGISADPTSHDLATFDVYAVLPSTPPEVERRTHRIEEAPLPTRRPDGSWVQAWVVRDVTPEEKAAWDVANTPQPDWMAFGVDLAMHPGITALYESLPGPVAGGLSIGLNEAGKGDPRLFFGLWSRLMAAGAISAELLGAIAVMAVEHHLPQSFMEALRPSET